jgi:hypothetical protein
MVTRCVTLFVTDTNAHRRWSGLSRVISSRTFPAPESPGKSSSVKGICA